MLLVHIVLFMVCWGPRLLWDVAIRAVENPRFSNATYALRVLFFLLPFVHSATNPILYLFMSSSLRRSLARNVLRRSVGSSITAAATSRCVEVAATATQHPFNNRTASVAISNQETVAKLDRGMTFSHRCPSTSTFPDALMT
jgi:hypothetical protein